MASRFEFKCLMKLLLCHFSDCQLGMDENSLYIKINFNVSDDLFLLRA